MVKLDAILVVDDSKVYSELLATLLRPHARTILTTTSVQEAITVLESRNDLDIVVCAMEIGEDAGFEVLEHVASLAQPRPRVIMVSGSWDDVGRARAARFGATDCLDKPTKLRDLMRVIYSDPCEQSNLNQRVRCVGVAYLLDTGERGGEHLVWDLHNLGPDGAFLETKGPLPVGEELELLLELAGGRARIRARVVRVQEPSWLDIGGVGIAFVEVGDEARAVLDATFTSERERASSAADLLR